MPTSRRRVNCCLFFLFLSSVAVLAFGRQQPSTSTGPANSLRLPVVIGSASGTKVRFTAPGATAAKVRMQIVSDSGEVLFDSAWKDGNVLDWESAGNQGEPLAAGSYRCVIEVMDLRGTVTETDAALSTDGQRVSLDPAASGSDGLAILGSEGDVGPKMTLLAHDGANGTIVSTSGDLSFRFGNFLAAKDIERMRLTADGELRVDGYVHPGKGIMFPDGTIMTTAGLAGNAATVANGAASPAGDRPGTPSGASAAGVGGSSRPDAQKLAPHVMIPALPVSRPEAASTKLIPRKTTTPAAQFVVGDTGVSVGTTNPAYALTVTGTINTGSSYNLGGLLFAHNFGQYNAFLGIGAGNTSLTGSGNTGVGYSALNHVTGGASNTALGDSALANCAGGNDNTGVGVDALGTNSSGGNNTAVGFGALFVNDAGSDNTAVGADALLVNNSLYGSENTAVGSGALQHATYRTDNALPNENTAVGYHAGFAVTTSAYNVLIGSGAGSQITTGFDNIAIGSGAGVSLTTGSSNIDIGNDGQPGDSYIIRIGQITSKTFINGISGITTSGAAVPVVIDGFGQLGTVSSSRRYKFDISDMGARTDDLMRLRPVTFRYIAHGDNAPLQYGLIAEEVAEVYPEMVTRNKDGEPDAVMYQFLAPMLLNEVQKQHQTIEDQSATIERQATDIDTLNKTLAAVEKRLDALEKRAAQN